MSNYQKKFKEGVIFGLGFLLITGLGFIATNATWTSSSTNSTDNNLYVSGEETLTADKWNALVDSTNPNRQTFGFNVSNGNYTAAATATRGSVTCAPFSGNPVIMDCEIGNDTNGRSYTILNSGVWCLGGTQLRENSIIGKNKARFICRQSSDNIDYIGGVTFLIERDSN